MGRVKASSLALLVGAIGFATSAGAQPLGAFRWQLQPYCNVITLAVVQQGGQYQLDGLDDQCGAAVKASVVGLAFQNPNGSIGFGLTIVTAPGGTPVHVDATIAIATLSGTWHDSAGNSGPFIFTPGAGIGGGPRPVPPGGLAANSVTTTQIAPAAVTNAQLAPNAVTGANVVDGSLTTADILGAPRAVFASGNQLLALTGPDQIVRSVTLTIPSAGTVMVQASGFFQFTDASATTEELARCSVTTGTSIDFSHLIAASDKMTTNVSVATTPFGATRGFNVTAGSFTVNLVCNQSSGTIFIHDSSLSAIFIGS